MKTKPEKVISGVAGWLRVFAGVFGLTALFQIMGLKEVAGALISENPRLVFGSQGAMKLAVGYGISSFLWLTCAGYAAYLFFTRDRRFPSLMIFLLISLFFLNLLDATLASALGTSPDAVFRAIFGSGLGVIIWSAYLLRSKRVKNTFTNGNGWITASSKRSYSVEDCQAYEKLLDEKTRAFLRQRVNANIAAGVEDYSPEAFKPTEEEVAAMNLPAPPYGFKDYQRDKDRMSKEGSSFPSDQPPEKSQPKSNPPAEDAELSLETPILDPNAERIAELQAEIDRLKNQEKKPAPRGSWNSSAVKSPRTPPVSQTGAVYLAVGLFLFGIAGYLLTDYRQDQKRNADQLMAKGGLGKQVVDDPKIWCVFPNGQEIPLNITRDYCVSGKGKVFSSFQSADSHINSRRHAKKGWCVVPGIGTSIASSSDYCASRKGRFFATAQEADANQPKVSSLSPKWPSDETLYGWCVVGSPGAVVYKNVSNCKYEKGRFWHREKGQAELFLSQQ